MRTSLRLAALALAAIALTTPHAFAVSKEIVQLQTQIQQLQEAVARLQQSNDERMGVMKDLVQQTTDAVNKMSVTLDAVQRQGRTQSEASTTRIDQVTGQMQSLNDSLDELKARLGRMEKNIAEMQNAQQSINARMESSATPTASAPVVETAPPPVAARDKPKPTAASTLPTNPAAPPVEDLYRTAYGDYNGAKYPLATVEFNDVIKFYPDSNYAGNAYFYLGEMEYKAARYGPASRDYDKVIEQYPGNPKIAISQLRKGESLLALKQTDAGARELRSLIQRFPASAEATTARGRLNALGITIAPSRARPTER